jgi:CHAD domain-containing protein
MVLERVRESMTRPSPEKLHRTRIQLKQLRDAIELFSSCYNLHLGRLHKMLEAIHQALGELNDIAATRSQALQVVPILDKQIADKIPEIVLLLHKTIGDEQTAQYWLTYLEARQKRRQ